MVLSIFAVFEELTMSTELRHKSALQNIYLRRENEQTNSPLPPFLSHRIQVLSCFQACSPVKGTARDLTQLQTCRLALVEPSNPDQEERL